MLQHLIKRLDSKMNSGQNNNNLYADLNALQTAIQELKLLEARSIAAMNLKNTATILNDLNKAEFKVFSQWGDDGIIQFLVDYLQIEPHTFIEFGVENYDESNTRFLLVNNCWKGLVMDGSENNVNQIKQSNLYWQYQLQAKCAFIYKDNITSKFFSNLSVLVLLIDKKLYCSLVAYCVILINCFFDIFGGHISSANFSTSLNAAGKNNRYFTLVLTTAGIFL
jgi:hypothetical protein